MTLLSVFLLCPFAILNLIFVVEVIAGLRTFPNKTARKDSCLSAVLIVPAHDEQAIIGCTLEALIVAAADRAKILVVADNCSDATAEIARSKGVAVIERFDEAKRGKGFALDFARAELRTSPPGCVLIVDADCKIDHASISLLIDHCQDSGLPGQAVYLLQPDRLASPLVQISNFAFCLRNLVRQRGLQRLSGRVHLTGTGMAFPWPVFESANLATASIVEDLQLGISLAAHGLSPQLVPQATVWSGAASEAETLVQRRRWEGGFLATALHAGPRALSRALLRGSSRSIWAALDLFVPPVALLVILDLVTLAVGSAVFRVSGSGRVPLLLLVTSSVFAGAALLVAWMKEGRAYVSLRSLMTAPIYLCHKLALYFNLMKSGAPSEWQRTRRDRN